MEIKENLLLLSMTRSGHNFIRNNIKSWREYKKYINAESVYPEKLNQFLVKNKYSISFAQYKCISRSTHNSL